MKEPYRRVVVLHVTIVLGAFVVDTVGAPVAALLLLVGLKTATDLHAHLREHRRAAERRERTDAAERARRAEPVEVT
jgi:heme exporter protein D